MPDHIHIFIGYSMNQLIPDLVEEIKTSSHAWIRNEHLTPFKFEWQKGYGAFTYSHSQIDAVVKYIILPVRCTWGRKQFSFMLQTEHDNGNMFYSTK